MSPATFFVQECPTCGRSLEIQVEYLGRWVVCQHCHGRLRATEGSPSAEVATTSWLVRRADELLELASQRRALAN